MSKKPTSRQIDKEYRELEACLKFVPHYTKFHDDNHGAIRAALQALADRLSTDLAYEMAGADEISYVAQARIDAAQWLNGEINESPSSGWQSFKPTPRSRGTRI